MVALAHSPAVQHPLAQDVAREVARHRQPGAPVEAASGAIGTPLIHTIALWDREADRSPRLRTAWSQVDEAPGASTALTPPTSWRVPVVMGEDRGQDKHLSPTLSVPVPGLTPGVDAVLCLDLACTTAQPVGLEIWHQDDAHPGMLSMHDGWYSDAAQAMALQTLHTRLPYGTGLPGLAWELSSPAYFSHIGTSQLFVRADAARQSGLHHGLAIPVAPDATVLTLLTGAARPFARRVELALGDGRLLRCVAGHCQRQGDLLAQRLDPPWGAPLLAELASQRGPVLTHRDEVPAHADWFEVLDAEVLLTWPFTNGATPMCMAMWL